VRGQIIQMLSVGFNTRGPRVWATGCALLAFGSVAACAVDDGTRGPAVNESPLQPGGAGGSAGAPPMTSDPVPAPPSDPGNPEGPPDIGMVAAGGTGAIPTAPPVADAGPVEVAPPVIVNVTGRVVDFSQRPLPGVPVTIDGTTVATNAQGLFSIAGVEAPYTASLTINQQNGRTVHYGYVFEGLTRVDPTLQVRGGLPNRTADLNITAQNADFTDATRSAIVTYSSPDLALATNVDSLQSTFPVTSWTGPATTTGTAHGLLVRRDGTSSTDPIIAYEAHQAAAVAMSDGVDTNVTLDLSADAIPTATVGGNVTVLGGVTDYRENRLFLRFSDGTRMPIIEDGEQPDAFSYTVPIVQGATLSLTALDNDGFLPFRSVHRENIAPGQTGITLALPNAVTLNSPPNGAVITPDTPFVWSGFGQTATTFVWHLEFLNTFDGMFIITNRTDVTLPEFADGLSIAAGVPAYWSVETHGDMPTVDAATGPNGYMDLTYSFNQPVLPTAGDGYFTESERRDVSVE
jgi:hypothetical protein